MMPTRSLLVLIFVFLPASLGITQSTGQAPKAPTPQWQIDAGGKMAFDVASVKQDKTDPSASTVHYNVPLGSQDAFVSTGGRYSVVNFPLSIYLNFAYKLKASQFDYVRQQLPDWANKDRYDIEAHAPAGVNPTKDQYRLMMQALLADRFKLAVHYETRQLPVLALVLDKTTKLGPQLQRHPDNVSCSTAPPKSDSPVPTVAGGFPEPCGFVWIVQPSAPGRLRRGARAITMTEVAESLFGIGNLGNPGNITRPILDETGLKGQFDFVMEWTPELRSPALDPTFQPDANGPTFLQALKDQLGLKLESKPASVDVLVVDRVEQPSAN